MGRKRHWLVRIGQRGEYRYIGKDGKGSAKTVGEAHVFASWREAASEADLWTNGHVEPRNMDPWH